MRVRRLATAAFSLALVAGAVTAAPAAATFHLMSVREVYPGSAAAPGAEYVEMQAYAPGQNLVGGHKITIYGPTGTLTGTDTFANNASRSVNQATFLLATPQAESLFGVTSDDTISPADQMNPSGGAVCWEGLDCVSWGSFTGTLPSPAGAPADPAGIPDGQALRRSIAPGCATLLEPTDDSGQSATDLFDVFPAPRPNSVAPSEVSCPGSPPPPSEGGPPSTTIAAGPKGKTFNRTAKFRFTSDAGDATFECRLDSKPFRACTSPITFRNVTFGSHRFTVRAVHDGQTDASPATRSFTVARHHRRHHH